MKRFTVPALVCAALSFLALSASAADLKATIPFDFHLGNAVLPAGDYSIQYSAALPVLIFRNSLGKPAAMASTRPPEKQRKDGASVLMFHQIGNEYFLNALWTPTAPDGGLSIPTSTREKEAYARAQGTVVARVSTPVK